jgi:hypothetical protein
MPVTIGEFEVMAEPPAAPPAAAPAAPVVAAAPDPVLLQRLLAQLHEQALRLWAH